MSVPLKSPFASSLEGVLILAALLVRGAVGGQLDLALRDGLADRRC